MNANIAATTITMSLVSLIASISIAHKALKYMKKCNELEKELKKYKESEASN